MSLDQSDQLSGSNFDILFYTSPQAMWIFDALSFRFIEVNEAAIQIYGYSREEFLGMTIKEIRPVDNIFDIEPSKVNGEMTNTIESRHYYKNRQVIDVEVTSFPFSYKGLRSRLVYVRDITSKKKRESALEYLNKAGKELSLTLDTQSALEKISRIIVPRFANWLTINVLKGENLELLFVENEDPEYVRYAYRHRKENPITKSDPSLHGHILRTGESSFIPVITVEMLEVMIEDKEQLEILKRLNLRSSIVVPMKVKNRIIGTVNFISTIADKQFDVIDLEFATEIATRIGLTLENARLHEELHNEIQRKIESEGKKDEFISVASHELKTPLTTALASMQTLERTYKRDPLSESILKLVAASGKSLSKLSGLIGQLLDVSRLEGGQLKLHKSQLNLFQLIKESCETFKLIGIHTFMVKGDANLEIHADGYRLDQVVINILSNAVKYSPGSFEIEIMVERVADQVKVSFTDHGIGISEEKLPHIFERYYRSDHLGIQYSGLGLGLYISSEIIKMHGGTIGARSKLGEGSTFWFTLPFQTT